jgi:Type ISP C-terminal specificity domain
VRDRAGLGHVYRVARYREPGRDDVVERDQHAYRAVDPDPQHPIKVPIGDQEPTPVGLDRVRDSGPDEEGKWKNIPTGVWEYTIGGYQVIKKWLSYRERDLLGRDMKPEEVEEVSAMTRRIAAIVLLGPAFDANYEAVRKSTNKWVKRSLKDA